MKTLHHSTPRQGTSVATDGSADRSTLVGGLPMPPSSRGDDCPYFLSELNYRDASQGSLLLEVSLLFF